MRTLRIPSAATLVACSFAALSACGSADLDAQLRTRAAFDLSCGEDQIEITNLGGDTRGVRGCEQRATYVLQCSGYTFGRCTGGDWIANTAGGEAAPE